MLSISQFGGFHVFLCQCVEVWEFLLSSDPYISHWWQHSVEGCENLCDLWGFRYWSSGLLHHAVFWKKICFDLYDSVLQNIGIQQDYVMQQPRRPQFRPARNLELFFTLNGHIQNSVNPSGYCSFSTTSVGIKVGMVVNWVSYFGMYFYLLMY